MEDQSKKDILENESEIVEKAKTDDAAFEILYNHYFPKIYGYLFKRTGNHETAEDLVSTTFMKVFCNLKKYEFKGFSFGAWLYKIATNNLIDYYRKIGKRKEVDIEQVKEPVDTSAAPEKLAQRSQERQIIQVVLAQLSDRYQKVLNLRYFAEMSNDEISKILEISVNNTRVLVHRSLKHFQKIYKKYEK